MGGLQGGLQALLSERVSIRDRPTILEGIHEACTGAPRGVAATVAIVRARLARQISDSHTGAGGAIPMITLSPEWETNFAESLIGPADERQLAMAPSKLGEFIRRFRDVMDTHGAESPVLLTSPGIRVPVRSVVERLRPAMSVLAQTEISTRSRIKTLASI